MPNDHFMCKIVWGWTFVGNLFSILSKWKNFHTNTRAHMHTHAQQRWWQLIEIHLKYLHIEQRLFMHFWLVVIDNDCASCYLNCVRFGFCVLETNKTYACSSITFIMQSKASHSLNEHWTVPLGSLNAISLCVCVYMLSELRSLSKIISRWYLILCKWHHHICALIFSIACCRSLPLWKGDLYYTPLKFFILCIPSIHACNGLKMNASGKILHIADRLEGYILWTQFVENLDFKIRRDHSSIAPKIIKLYSKQLQFSPKTHNTQAYLTETNGS